MKLLAFDMPEETSQLAEWLEAHLVGIELQDLIANLLAFKPEAVDSKVTLEEICGEQLPIVLHNGLGELSREQLSQLINNPGLLLELQEQIVVQGGDYWLNRSGSDVHQKQMDNSWNAIQSQLNDLQLADENENDTLSATVKIVRDLPNETKNNWKRQLLVSAVAIAAVVVISVTLRELATPAPTGWGWNRPGALTAENLSGKEYLNNLADSANEWFNKRPDNKDDLIKRLTQFRNGCDTLIRAPHAPLAKADREWLIERCGVWSQKLHDQVAALQKGEDVSAILETSDGIINKLMDAMRKRAETLG